MPPNHVPLVIPEQSRARSRRSDPGRIDLEVRERGAGDGTRACPESCVATSANASNETFPRDVMELKAASLVCDVRKNARVRDPARGTKMC